MIVPPISDEDYESKFGPLELDEAFRQLATLARSYDKGNVGDYAGKASQILRTRAAFVQVKAQLKNMEDEFETEVAVFKTCLLTELGALARYEEERG